MSWHKSSKIFNRFFALTSAAFLSGTFSAQTFAKMEYNLPEPVSPVTRDIYDLHMLTSYIAIAITLLVIVLMAYIIIAYRKTDERKACLTSHTSFLGRWGWIAVPVLVLGIDLSIAGPGKSTLKFLEKQKPAELTIKITGSQWKWAYEYMEDDYSFVSSLSNEDLDSPGYLREVDNPLVLPTGVRIRLLHTASDVIHNWWVPSIAHKKDAIPGYILETWTKIEKEGTYYGQCAEICGAGHAYMPIVVHAVSPSEFDKWMAEKKGDRQAVLAEASSDKLWSKDELMEKGEEVYQTNCSACHKVGGEGISDVFPAIKGSAIATGELGAHLDIVLNGKAGTAMSAWAGQLNDLDLAAVLTYQRNAWGNDTGDAVQPAQIKKSRGEDK